jgi:hypothetical protein
LKIRGPAEVHRDSTWDCPDDSTDELYLEGPEQVKLMPWELPLRTPRYENLLPEECRICALEGHLGNECPVLIAEDWEASVQKYNSFKEWLLHRRNEDKKESAYMWKSHIHHCGALRNPQHLPMTFNECPSANVDAVCSTAAASVLPLLCSSVLLLFQLGKSQSIVDSVAVCCRVICCLIVDVSQSQ